MSGNLLRYNFVELDFKKLLVRFLRHWWLIVLTGMIGAAVAMLYSVYFITPLYRTSVTIYVNNVSGTKTTEYVSGSDLSVSAQLVNTYVNIVSSNTVLQKVSEYLGESEYTPAELRSIMTASQVGDTEIFKIYVSNTDPIIAARIANAIADVAPAEIQNILDGSSTKIIDYAKVPTERYSPSYRKNTVVGFFCGIAISASIIAALGLFDVRLKDTDDLQQLFQIPILGQIPEIEVTMRTSTDKTNGYSAMSS